jgi:hypothetical protein
MLGYHLFIGAITSKLNTFLFGVILHYTCLNIFCLFFELLCIGIFIFNLFFEKRLGGAFGFLTEGGPGSTPMPLESWTKTVPQNKLWPINDYWDWHCGNYQGVFRYILKQNN